MPPPPSRAAGGCRGTAPHTRRRVQVWGEVEGRGSKGPGPDPEFLIRLEQV